MKLKRIWGIIAVSLSTVLLTSGCIKLEMDMTVATDDTVSGTMVFAISKSLAEMGAEESGSETSSTPETDNLFTNAENVKVEPFDDGEFVGSSYAFEDLPLAQFAPQVGDNSAFAIERQGDNLVVSGVLDTSTEGQDMEENQFTDSIIEGFAGTTSMRISVTLPGEIIETNGEVDGQTITWNGSFGEKLDLQAVAVSPLSGPVNWLLVGGAAGVLLGIIGILFTWLTGRKKKTMSSVESGKKDPKTAKPKKQTKAEILAAEALAARPWYQKKRFAFPAIAALALSLLAIAIGLVLPPEGRSASTESGAQSAEEKLNEKDEAIEESEKPAQGQSAPAPAAPAAPPAQPEPQVVIVKVQEPAPAGRTPPAVQVAPAETESQQYAREDATYYWSEGWYSRSGLINYLVSLGYSYADAEYGTDSIGVDWYSEASGMADWYLSGIYMSRLGLIDQLEWEGFSTDEATYGTDSTGADWYSQAYGKAVELMAEGYTEQEAYEYLLNDYYAEDEAWFGAYYAFNPQ